MSYEDKQQMGLNNGKKGNFELIKGMSGAKSKYDKGRTVQQSRGALKTGLQNILGMDGGIAGMLSEGGSSEDIGSRIFDELSQKNKNNPEYLQNMIKNGNQYEKGIAQMFLSTDTQKNGGFSKKASDMMVEGLVSAGLDNRVGATSYENAEMDPRIIGKQTADQMMKITEINQATLSAMDKIVKDVYGDQ
jgi:hypothetical protein